MKLIPVLLLCLLSVRACTISSKGFLVGANCFQSEERNINPGDINLPADQDVDLRIRACYPRANKTRTFMVVLSSGEIFSLDAAGNALSAKLVAAAGKPGKGQPRFAVDITGSTWHETIHVDSISAAR